MNKEQAVHYFWSQFGVPAYDTNTVPEDAELPRITYEVTTGGFGSQTVLGASIWDRSTSWESVSTISRLVSKKLSCGGQTILYDDGMLWVKMGMPFSQRTSDPDDSIRRILLNIEVEYLSEV